jgi:hypothetical protein
VSDTAGAIIVGAILVVLMGPIFVWMAIDGFTAAAEMWRDLLRGRR